MCMYLSVCIIINKIWEIINEFGTMFLYKDFVSGMINVRVYICVEESNPGG
jgi:hypothetical protein